MSNLKTTVLALVLVVLTAGALWYTSRAVKLGYTNVYCAPYGGCPQWQERGLPLFILAIFSGHLEKLPRSGGWMIWLRQPMSWVLIGMAGLIAGTFLITSQIGRPLAVIASVTL
jgi:hypothetical protein